MNITPSQTLFSFWRDMCGGTPLFVGAKISGVKSTRDKIYAAYVALCRMHPALRTHYWSNDDGYDSDRMALSVAQQFDAKPDRAALQIADVSTEEALIVFSRFQQQALQFRLGCDQDPNHRILVALCGDQVHSIAFAVEHIFLDGLSCDQVLADFVDILLNSNADVEHFQSNDSDIFSQEQVDRYCAAFNELPPSDPYLQEFMGARTLYLGTNPRSTSVQARSSSYRSISVRIPNQNRSMNVQRHSMSDGYSQFSYLLACFEIALQAADPTLKNLAIQIATHGRVLPSAKLARNVVGCFASALPYRLSFDAQVPRTQWASVHERRIRPLIARYVDQISAKASQDALFGNRSLRAKLRNEAFASAIRTSAVSNVYFSFFGTSAVERLGHALQVQEFDFGTSNLPGSLDVMLINVGNELVASFNYDALYFNEAYVNTLSSEFTAAISLVFASSTTRDTKPSSGDDFELSDEIADFIADTISKVAVRTIKRSDLVLDIDMAFDLGIDSLGRTIAVDALSQGLNTKIDYATSERLFTCASLREFVEIFELERRM